MLTAAFPSGDLGPVDFCALRRLASNCLSVAISLSFANKAKLGRWKEHRQECLYNPDQQSQFSDSIRYSPVYFLQLQYLYPYDSSGREAKRNDDTVKLFVLSIKYLVSASPSVVRLALRSYVLRKCFRIIWM